MEDKVCYVIGHCPEMLTVVRNLIQRNFQITTVNSFQSHHVLVNESIDHLNEVYDESLKEFLNSLNAKSKCTEIVIIISSDFSFALQQVKLVSSLRVIAMIPNVAVVIDPCDFDALCNSEDASKPVTDEKIRQHLTAKVFNFTAQYDLKLAHVLAEGKWSASILKNAMVVGSGAREHVIARHLLTSCHIAHVFVAPGNYGTAVAEGARCSNVDVSADDITGLVAFALANSVSLVIVGAEQPLVDGLTDAMHAKGVPCFGPSQKAALIEASKAFSKEFMSRHHLHTADYRVFTDFAEAELFLLTCPFDRVVVKVSGLAAGKGVLLPHSTKEAVSCVHDILVKKVFGAAGSEVVIEEFLEGVEVSVLAFCDGVTAVPMPPAQDHKRVGDFDSGPNTGGMGAYAPVPTSVLSQTQYEVCARILQDTVTALATEGRAFTGVLFGGFILPSGRPPMLLEYNCRFGDPEAQVLLSLLQSDLFALCMACVEQRLDASLVQWDTHSAAVTVVCASEGYPKETAVGREISGLDRASEEASCVVYHGGSAQQQGTGQAVTTGGRVLSVTATDRTLAGAVEKVYMGVHCVHFDGMHFRSDIARQGLATHPTEQLRQAPVIRVGVLGSTRGTSLQPILDAISSHQLQGAEISVVISNKEEAGILHRAQNQNIDWLYLPVNSLTREEYDQEVSDALTARGVDLVLLIGYMRIVSKQFIATWEGRLLNVHPSLLPAFPGLMDLKVHEAVLNAGATVTGCTVHHVVERVDGGEVVVQLSCPVDYPADTQETLKDKVQQLEGRALIQAIEQFRDALSVAHEKGETYRESGTVTYKDAGVDIVAGEKLVSSIQQCCAETRRLGCMDASLGGFGAVFDLSQCPRYSNQAECCLVSGTDGVGTKLLVAQEMGVHSSIGIDLVAMCANDALACGAEPMFFLDYFATGALDVTVAASVVSGIAQGCKKAGCALVGGETAEMRGMYRSANHGSAGSGAGEYDLAGFCVGAALKTDLLPRGVKEGDVVLGLRSSGLHSNGFSLVRKCVELAGVKLSDPAPFPAAGSSSLGEVLLTPTAIYVNALLPLVHQGLVKALAHITGGGLLENVPRVLPSDLAVEIDVTASEWRLPAVFRWLQSVAKLPQHELLRTFNCGVGMVVIVSEENERAVWEALSTSSAEESWPMPLRLGRVVRRGQGGADGSQVKIFGDLI